MFRKSIVGLLRVITVLVLLPVFLINYDIYPVIQTAKAVTPTCSSLNISVVRNSFSKIYTDYPPGITYPITSAYAGYKVTNNTASAIDDLWVKIDNFTGTDIFKAQNEDGVFHYGELNPANYTFAYFLLSANNPGNGSLSGNHDITIYDGSPTFTATPLCKETYSLTAENTIDAAANKVEGYTVGPNPSELGGILTMFVNGTTGTIGSANEFIATPATFGNTSSYNSFTAAQTWHPESYELIDVQMIFNFGITDVTVHDTLYVNASSPQPPVAGPYRIIYTFKATGATTGPSNISPVNNISSGTQIKHTNSTDTFVSDPIKFPPIQAADNFTKITSMSISPSILSNGGNAIVTINLVNNGTIATTLDDFVITLPISPAVPTFVTGTAQYNSVAIDNAYVSGVNNQILTFVGTFSIAPNGGTSTLTFTINLPDIDGEYDLSSIGHVSITQIDTTALMGDNLPATTSASVGSPPTTDMSVNVTGPTGTPLYPGFSTSFTATIANDGPDASTGSVLTFPVSSGFTLDTGASSALCSQTLNIITCNIGAIASGGSIDLDLVFDISNSVVTGLRSFNFSLDQDQADPILTNNSDSLSFTVYPKADIAIELTGPSSINAGDQAHFTAIISNAGPNTSNNIIATYILPAGTSIDTILTSPECTESLGILTCNISSLASGANTSLAIYLDTTISTTGPLISNISVSADEFDPVLTDNDTANISHPSGEVTTSITAPVYTDMEINISGPSGSIYPGSSISYQIDIVNNGPDTSTGSTVLFTLPLGYTLDTVLSSAYCTVLLSTVTCEIPSINSGDTNTFDIVLDLDETVIIGGETITFDVYADNTDNTSANNSEISNFTVSPAADIDITLSTSTPTITAGDSISLIATITNYGPNDANNIELTYPLPAGTTFNASLSSPECSESLGVITCIITSLAADDFVDLDIVLDTDIYTTGPITNSVSITADEIDPDLINNDTSNIAHASGDLDINVNATVFVDLDINISTPTGDFIPGTSITIPVEVVNNGPDDSTGSSIEFTLPANSTLNLSLSSAYCSESLGLVTCTLPGIGSGLNISFDIVLDLDASYPTGNTAIDFESIAIDTDTDSSNDLANLSFDINPAADISISMSGNALITAGGNLTYLITIDNNGPNTANNLVVTNVLPSDTTFNSALSSNACLESLGIITCDISSLTSGSSEGLTIVLSTSLTITGPTINNISVTADEIDPDLVNNDTSNISHPSGEVSTDIDPAIITDLEISINTDTSNVIAGGSIHTEVIVTNNGPDNSTGGIAIIPIPSGLTFDNINSSNNCTETPIGYITCTFGVINSGESQTFDIYFDIPINYSGPDNISIDADVSANDNDTDNSNNSTDNSNNADIIIQTATIDLNIGIFGADTSNYNSTKTYTYSYGNTGNLTSNNVIISTTLPAHTSFNPANSTLGWICTPNNNAPSTCTFNAGNINPNATGSVNFAVDILDYSNGPFSDIILNASIADDGSSVSDSNMSDNSAEKTTLILYTNVFDPPSSNKTVLPNGDIELEWKMVWINDGNTMALNVRIVDPVPAGTAYVPNSFICEARGSSTTSLCAFDSINNRVVWEGNIAHDIGGTTEENSLNEVVLIFKSTKPANGASVINQARAYWDDNQNGSIDDDIAAGQVASLSNNPNTGTPLDSTIWIPQTLVNTSGVNNLAAIISLGLIFFTAIILSFDRFMPNSKNRKRKIAKKYSSLIFYGRSK